MPLRVPAARPGPTLRRIRRSVLIVLAGTVAAVIPAACTAAGTSGAPVAAPGPASAAATAPASSAPAVPGSGPGSGTAPTGPAPAVTTTVATTVSVTDPGTPTAPTPGPSNPAGTTTGPAASGTPTDPGPTGATSPRTVDPATLAIAGNLYAWRTPSGNIFCLLQDGDVYCQAATHDFDYQGGHCGTAGADGVEIRPGDLLRVDCYGDPPQNRVGTLAYGSTVTVGAVRCSSATNGMQCVDTGHGDGFLINRSAITLLPSGEHPLPRRTTPSAAGGPVASALAPFVGTWDGHGRQLHVDAQGGITISYRVYRWCGAGVAQPCDTVKNSEITAGGHLTAAVTAATGEHADATVTGGNAAAYPTGKAFPLDLAADVITTPLGTFCGPHAQGSPCGA